MKIFAFTTLLSLLGSTAANKCSASNYQALLEPDLPVSEKCTTMAFELCCDTCGDMGFKSPCWGQCMNNVEPVQREMVKKVCMPKPDSCDAFLSLLSYGNLPAYVIQGYSDCCGTECEPSFDDMKCYGSCMMRKQDTLPSFARRLRKNTCSASYYQALLEPDLPVSEKCTTMAFELCCDTCGDMGFKSPCWGQCMNNVEPVQREMVKKVCMPKPDSCDAFLSLLSYGNLPAYVIQGYSDCCGTECEPSFDDMKCYASCIMKEHYNPFN